MMRFALMRSIFGTCVGTLFIANAAVAAPGDYLVLTNSSGTGNSNGEVTIVDPDTGSANVVGDVGASRSQGILDGLSGPNILVADFGPSASSSTADGKIFQLNRNTGAVTTVASGGSLYNPACLALDASGNLIVGDDTRFIGPDLRPDGQIVRIDRTTGQQSVLTVGGDLEVPVNVAVEPSGDILVLSQSFPATKTHKLIRIDPGTGARTTVWET